MATIHALRTLLTGRLVPWAAVMLLMVVGAAHAGTPAHHVTTSPALRALSHRVLVLEHACVPMYTGGGVTQCAQPSTEVQRVERALRACMGNRAYIGVTQEDTWALHAQCLDDWDDAHPRR